MKYNWKEYYSQWDIYAAIEEQNKLLKVENRNLKEENNRLKQNAMEDMRVQTKLEEQNKKLECELDKANELLSNVGRCSEQYREKMVSIMEELKNFLYKD